MNIETAEQMLTPAVRQALPYITGFLLLWFANMALTGWLAGRRGREDGLWTVFAMLTGPIALVVLLVLPRVAPEDVEVDVTRRPAAPLTGPEWPAFSPPPTPISTRERLVASLFGAVLAALVAGLIIGAGDLEKVAIYAVIAGSAGWLVGRWQAGNVIDADRNRLIGTGLLAGVAILSANALLAAVIGAIPTVVRDPTAVVALPFALLGAVFFPVLTPAFYPGLLGLALVGGVFWAASTHILILRARRPGSVAGSAATA